MMAAQSNSSQEQTNTDAKDEKSGNFSLKKSMPNFSSGDEDEEFIAPSPVFLKFSRPRGKPQNQHESRNEMIIKDENNVCKEASTTCSPLTKSRVKDVIEFSSMLKPRALMGDSFSDEIGCLAASKANQNCELDVSGVKRKKKKRNIMRAPNTHDTSSDTSPDSGLMEKARKYSQKIGSRMREEKKAIAKQYFHELLHSCDQNIDEDEKLKNSGQEQVLAHKKKRKAEMACGISHSRQEEQEYLSQVEKGHKKKRSKVAQKCCSDGRNALNEGQSLKTDQSSSKFSITPNSETLVHNSSSDARVMSDKRILRDMLSIDGADQRHEKPQRRCRQNFYLNIPKELQWPSASESDSEEDIVDVNTVCSRKQHKPSKGSPGNSPGHYDPGNSMQMNIRRNNECSPNCRRTSSKRCQNMISQHQGDRENVHSLYNEQMWLYNSANLSEGATAMHSSLVRNINTDQLHEDGRESENVNSREKHHSGQNDPSSDQKNKVLNHDMSVISKSDDESISGESCPDIFEENSLDGNSRETFPIRRSQRFLDRRDCRWSSFERRETENPLIPSPEFLHPPQSPLLVARLTSLDCAGQRSSSRSSVKGRPLRPNRNCRQRHEVAPSPRSQRMFQTVNQMDGDEEMARRLQEEMDFEYAMTLHNAENQAPAPPCPRLSEYHSHDSDSPTMMLTRGMRQATRDMDIVLESLFHDEAEDSPTESPMIDFPFGPHMLVSHGVNRRGNRSRGRRHDWTERLLQEELQQGRNNIPRRILSHSRTFSSNDYEDLLSIAELLGDVKPKGISSDEMNLLPEKKFHPNNKITSCSICMCDYILNERLKILPCFHEFHGECIEKWIVTNATCPICRVEVKL